VTAVRTDPHAVAATVTDPELPALNLDDLGVLRDVRVHDGTVVVDITPTYSGCPAMGVMRADLLHALHSAGMVRRTVDHFGRLDVLYNNAGLGRGGSITEIAEEDWDLVIDVDLKSIYLGCKYAIPEMKKGGGGSIVSTASIAGLRGSPGLHAYSAAKAGVINLTRSIAGEVGPFGIRVNCICPGIIVTPIWRQVVDLVGEQQEAMWKSMAQRVLLQRVGMPEDIARGALFLASDDSAYVTGHALVIDGGLTASDVRREG